MTISLDNLTADEAWAEMGSARSARQVENRKLQALDLDAPEFPDALARLVAADKYYESVSKAYSRLTGPECNAAVYDPVARKWNAVK